MSTYGLIISAGNQSRFGDVCPKSLMEYGKTGKTLLQLSVERMYDFCDIILPVVSFTNQSWFSEYSKIIIDSGYGCGDAVLKALRIIQPSEDDTCFIQWCDTLPSKELYSTLKRSYKDKWLIPCTYEEEPYVQIQTDSYHNVQHVQFSKYGETVLPGLHDLSLFYGNAKLLLSNLELFHKKIWKEDHYEHIHGNEMQFLDVFNDTLLPAKALIIDNYDAFSFNTIEEYQRLNSKVDISTI